MKSLLPVAIASVTLAAGCAGGRSAPPEAGSQRGGPPDLRGSYVMLFPVQTQGTLAERLDAEIAFALAGRSERVAWVKPDEIQAALDRTPSLAVPLRGLPVTVFTQREVERIGDPLFGYLRRVGGLFGSDLALIPVRAAYVAAPGASAGAGGGAVPGRIEISGALIEVRTGRVLWFGVVAGEAGAPDDPVTLASAADAFARRLVPIG